MIRARRGVARRRPQHARPSLLAPSRSVAAFGSLVVAVGLGLAGCAAVTSGGHGSAARALHPAAAPKGGLGVEARAELDGIAAELPPQLLSGADLLAMRGSGSAAPSPAGGVLLAAGGLATGGPADSAPVGGLAASGIPVTALTAYKDAATREAGLKPSCRLPWPLLAGIGRVESNHGRFAGAILHSDGVSTPRIIGIPLDGSGTALIRDTDGGRLDGDTVYDRAVGPMQFIPSTWAGWGVDANHDGRKDPYNVFDAAAAAADYLCAAGRDLSTYRGTVRAILSYNYSYAYVSLVMGLEHVYASGAVGVTVPVLPTSPEPLKHPKHPRLPPVDPGKPRGLPPTHKPTPPTTTTPSTAQSSSSSSAPVSSSSSTPSGSPSCPTPSAPSASASSSTATASSSAPSCPAPSTSVVGSVTGVAAADPAAPSPAVSGAASP